MKWTPKPKDPLFEKYKQKDDLITELANPVNLARPGVGYLRLPDSNEKLVFCPLCTRLQINHRMFKNKDGHWECPECHNVINPSDLGLKPLSDDQIVAVNDPYLKKARIYTPSKNILTDLRFTAESIKNGKRPKGFKMFDKKKFDSVQEAITAKL